MATGQISAMIFICFTDQAVEMFRFPVGFCISKQKAMMDSHIDFIGKDGDGKLNSLYSSLQKAFASRLPHQ